MAEKADESISEELKMQQEKEEGKKKERKKKIENEKKGLVQWVVKMSL